VAVGARSRAVDAGVAAALALALLVGPIATTPAAASPPQTRLLDAMNEARERRGLQPLHLARRASRRAERHSERMARAGRVFSRGHYPYRRWGENVGCGRSVAHVHANFMGDAEARRNLLRPRFRRVGIGVARSDPRRRFCRRATLWVTEVLFR
jgi:uncharacterized protein YkwD